MDLLTEEQKLSLFFQKGGNLVEMSCSIDKVLEDRLEVGLPQYFMRYIEFLQPGKKLTAKVFSKLGTIDFNAIVISSPLEDNFTIELDYNAMKLTPGRELPVINSIETMQVKSGDLELRLKTFEISTEYIKFYSDYTFKTEEIIDCSLILPKDYGIINFRAVITEVDPVYDNEFTATYSTMTENDKQSLLYYMYMYSNNIDSE